MGSHSGVHRRMVVLSHEHIISKTQEKSMPNLKQDLLAELPRVSRTRNTATRQEMVRKRQTSGSTGIHAARNEGSTGR